MRVTSNSREKILATIGSLVGFVLSVLVLVRIFPNNIMETTLLIGLAYLIGFAIVFRSVIKTDINELSELRKLHKTKGYFILGLIAPLVIIWMIFEITGLY